MGDVGVEDWGGHTIWAGDVLAASHAQGAVRLWLVLARVLSAHQHPELWAVTAVYNESN